MPVEARMDVKCKFSRAITIIPGRTYFAYPAAIIFVKLIQSRAELDGFMGSYIFFILCTFPNTITMAARVGRGGRLDCSHFIWLKVKNLTDMANSCNNSISYNLLQFPVLLSNSRGRKDLEDNVDVNVDEDDRDNLLVVDLFLVFHVSCLLVLLSQLVRLSAVADAPTIRLIGSPEIDLEEDKDALVLRCVADANPPASIVWRRAGRSEIASLQVSQQQHPTQPCGKLWPRLPASTPAPATTLAAVWPEIAPSLCVFILSVAEICNCIKLLTRFHLPPL